MRRIKNLCKVIALCMCIIAGAVATNPVMSYAQETETMITPRMACISASSTDLTISSSGMATVSGQVNGKIGVTSTYVKVTLQKKVLGIWFDVKEWEKSGDGRNTSITENYQVTKGTYRVELKCSADGETKTLTSAERVY